MTRFDICEAYYVFAQHYHASGITARCEYQGRGIWEQLSRMRFRPSPMLRVETLTEEARCVYDALVSKWHAADA
jgi:hypothetical protein